MATLSSSVETRPRDFPTVTEQRPYAPTILQTHQPTWYSREALRNYAAFQDHGRNQLSRPCEVRAVQVSTRLNMTSQLARLVERVKRNFDEKQLTGAVFFKVAKAFDSVWIEGLIVQLIILEFPSYLMKLITSYVHSRTFETSFQASTSPCHLMRAWVAHGGVISPVPFSLYLNDIPTPSCYIELALYADYTIIVAKSKQPTLLLKYIKT